MGKRGQRAAKKTDPETTTVIHGSADVPHFKNAAEEADFWPTADLSHLTAKAFERGRSRKPRAKPRKAA